LRDPELVFYLCLLFSILLLQKLNDSDFGKNFKFSSAYLSLANSLSSQGNTLMRVRSQLHNRLANNRQTSAASKMLELFALQRTDSELHHHVQQANFLRVASAVVESRVKPE
jgi:hypothetical protein